MCGDKKMSRKNNSRELLKAACTAETLSAACELHHVAAEAKSRNHDLFKGLKSRQVSQVPDTRADDIYVSAGLLGIRAPTRVTGVIYARYAAVGITGGMCRSSKNASARRRKLCMRLSLHKVVSQASAFLRGAIPLQLHTEASL